MNWHLILAIVGSVLVITLAVLLPFILGAMRLSGIADDTADHIQRAVAEAPNPHRTRLDGARGLICEHGCGCGGRLHGGGSKA
jgi:uncharacterized membrane protein